jgi:phosphomevalonate decarboxylase
LTRVTVLSHAIQGLVKYHGLKNPEERIPFHDSISVCVKELSTKTTVEAEEETFIDIININGITVEGSEKGRVERVLSRLREIAGVKCGFKVVSLNSLIVGKGLGFSSSGFSALGLAAAKALDLDLDSISLSEVVRLGAGSATRSLAGGFAYWHADKNGHSFAEMLADSKDVHLMMVVVPIPHDVKTDSIHDEMRTSPFFDARLRTVDKTLELMKKAILSDEVAEIGRLAELDSLSLHAATMAGENGWILIRPETILVIDEVRKLRAQGIRCWFSLDTGPSVFINTYPENAKAISEHIREKLGLETVISGVGGRPCFSEDHLF